MDKKKNIGGKITTALISLLLVAGVSLLLFPYIAQWVYTLEAQRVIRNYQADISLLQGLEDTPANGKRYFGDLYQKMLVYNETIYQQGQSGLVDPFSYEAASFDLVSFGFQENVVGHIDIPRMNVTLPIYLGATKSNMAKGAVHLSQTSLPIGTTNSNTVLAAHRGMSTAAMFRDIEALQVGDEVTVTNLWETLAYRVVETKVILPNDVDEILIQDGRELVTLITCHPLRYNYQRYVVYCERLPS
jgi:sortase A